MTLSAIRSAKATAKTKPTPREPNQDMALSAGRRFLKELEALPPARIASETRVRLQELRRAIIQRLDEIEGSRKNDEG